MTAPVTCTTCGEPCYDAAPCSCCTRKDNTRDAADERIEKLEAELAAANAIAEPSRRWADRRIRMHGKEGLEEFKADAEESRKEEQAVFDARRKELAR